MSALGFGGYAYMASGAEAEALTDLRYDEQGYPVYEDSAFNVRAPKDVRIIVEVLNATGKRGVARKATQYLRDRGFDVVLIGNAAEKLDTTMVLDRSNSPELAKLVAKAMKGRVDTRPDSSKYVDVTVLVGGNWAAPALPLNP